MSKEELLNIRSVIEDIQHHGISKNTIEYLYSIMGYDNIPLGFTNFSKLSAYFNPKYMNIAVNINKFNEWLDNVISDGYSVFDIKDDALLRAYLVIAIIAHEIEHSKQRLISKDMLEPNYAFKTDAYKDVYEATRIRRFLIPRPISLFIDLSRFFIYQYNANELILERNASLEGYTLASDIALLSGDKDIQGLMDTYKGAFMLMGYEDGTEGTLKHTYDKLLMMKRYNKLDIPDDISLLEKAREGLELTQEERDTLISHLVKNSSFKK